MSGYGPVGRSLLLAGSFCVALSGCAEKTVYDTQIALSITTDLEPSTQLDYVTVEVLQRTGDLPFSEPVTLRVAGRCGAQDGRLALGTLGVAAGQSSRARLRVRGYARVDDALTLVIERRVDAQFERDEALALSVHLGAKCLAVACADGRTCDPADGLCGAVPLLDELSSSTANRQAAGCAEVVGRSLPVASDAGTEMDARVTTEDASAQAKDDAGEDDRDGAPAEDADTNGDGASDAQSPDCEPLLDICCAPGTSTLAVTCGACVTACEQRKVELECGGESCEARCGPGYDDCTGDGPGCGTGVSTPSDCGGCGIACTYGVCSQEVCSFELAGLATADTSFVLTADTTLGTLLPLADTASIAAVGALVADALPGTQLTFGIYVDTADLPGHPNLLLKQGGPTATTDFAPSGVEALAGFRRVEVLLPEPVSVAPGRKTWLVVNASADTRIGGLSTSLETPWVEWLVPYSGFHETIDAYQYVTRQNLALYAVTTDGP